VVISGELLKNTKMLIGQYKVNVGDKKRIAAPKKFRDELGDKLILTRGFEDCLVIVNEKAWQDITSDVSEASYGLSEMREVSRFLVGGATELELDSQGRFVIPDHLLKYASIEKEVLFVGLMRWVEVWDEKKWVDRDQAMKLSNSSNAQVLSERLNNSKRQNGS
jgi:MraZ protein